MEDRAAPKAPVPRVEYELNPEMSSLDMVEKVDLTSRSSIKRAAFQPKVNQEELRERERLQEIKDKKLKAEKYKDWRREKKVD